MEAKWHSNITIIDGYTLQNNDRTLVKNAQNAFAGIGATKVSNGIYNYYETGIWTRSDDLPKGDNSVGATTFIENGATNVSTIFVQNNITDEANRTNIVGIDSLNFVIFSNIAFKTGDGLVTAGNFPTTLSVKPILEGFLELVSSSTFTDGTATLSTGTLSVNELTDGTATLSTGTLSLSELTDGTATLTNKILYQ